MHCYQCDAEVSYLFDDSRCFKCTRLSPEEETYIGIPANEADYSDSVSQITDEDIF